MKISDLLYIVTILFALSSCGDSSLTRTLPNVAGPAGEVLVVMDKDLWNGAAGDTLRNSLAPVLMGLPREEPAFDLMQVVPVGFRDIFLVRRNVVIVSIDNSAQKASVTSIRDRWAHTQLVITITAPDTLSLVNVILEESRKMRRLINDAERERLTEWLTTSAGKNINPVMAGSKEFKLIMPAGYKTDINRDGLLMISAETPATTQCVMISTSEPAHRRIDCVELANMTEKLTSAEVKGPDGKSFMVIEKRIPATCSSFSRNSRDYIELRGLWTLEGGYMGGPFISYAFVDTVAMKTVVVTGFVYAPREDKRELLRQVEALMYCLN